VTPETKAKMTAHVHHCASAHGVTVHWITSGWRNAESFPEEMTAYCPVIRSASDYLIALHEIGHCADPTAREFNEATDIRGIVLCEGAAWAYAAEVMLPSLRRHLRKADWDRVGYSFRSYIVSPGG
jgi:hypothetical protein